MAFCVEINPNGNTIKHDLVLQLYFLQEKDDGMSFAYTFVYTFDRTLLTMLQLCTNFFPPQPTGRHNLNPYSTKT